MDTVVVEAVTPDRWDDLVGLFGPNGACAGCWCMWWRQTAAEYDRDRGETNQLALRSLVEDGQRPGLLAYRDGEAVGWVSVGPRSAFGRLNRSPVLKPLDDLPVWSIVCFYVRQAARRDGVTRALVTAAVDAARAHQAPAVEAYPVDTERKTGSTEVFTGVPSIFRRAGFVEVARRSPTRPIMRLDLAAGP